jgi:formate dehydrogenase major subunit
VPDFPVDKAPDYVPPDDAQGMDAIGGKDPFMMLADGKAWLYAPSGLMDGPMPTHYEPLESPVDNVLYPEIDANPGALRWRRAENPYAERRDPDYPHVATTFRLTEQHTAGGMSRPLPWLNELQPVMFAEIDPLLAREHGIADGDWMVIVSPRAEIEARARVTERIRPLKVDGKVIHQVGLPWHWGSGGPSPGDAANDLVTLSGDPNTSIQESKAFVCNVRAGRRSEGTSILAGVHDAPKGTAIDRDHPSEQRPED